MKLNFLKSGKAGFAAAAAAVAAPAAGVAAATATFPGSTAGVWALQPGVVQRAEILATYVPPISADVLDAVYRANATVPQLLADYVFSDAKIVECLSPEICALFDRKNYYYDPYREKCAKRGITDRLLNREKKSFPEFIEACEKADALFKDSQFYAPKK